MMEVGEKILFHHGDTEARRKPNNCKIRQWMSLFKLRH
jgi:hypothetical protein